MNKLNGKVHFQVYIDCVDSYKHTIHYFIEERGEKNANGVNMMKMKIHNHEIRTHEKTIHVNLESVPTYKILLQPCFNES